MSLPATMGFQIGSGFGGVVGTGSQHNDPFYNDDGRIRTRTNNSGGTQGGISNGENIVFQIAFKPTATIRKEQETVDLHGEAVTLSAHGRHDPCVLPRAPAIVEAMTATGISRSFSSTARKNAGLISLLLPLSELLVVKPARLG